ncbi:GNAT family N-acetyltransferase [Paenibacillus taihuensis]|nr:GNAT family N-acetyltransferase [Paenibacillus taihuensis]
MQGYQSIKMMDYSNHQIDQIRTLEQLCKTNDRSSLRVGVESLKAIGGDEAYLCFLGRQLIGFVSWYTSDGTEANINGMVHPGFRRQGVFKALLKRAMSEMLTQGIETCRFRIPSNSKPGIDFIKHIGAIFRTSEFSMNLNQLHADISCRSGLTLQLAENQDLEFMVRCSSQAFGDSETWTRNYFARTIEPERVTYIALDSLSPVGMIRVNWVNKDTAVIHDLCVLTSQQGRGYGREILAGVVKLLLEQKCSTIRLGVVTENRRALNLYHSVGFEITAESSYYVITIHEL